MLFLLLIPFLAIRGGHNIIGNYGEEASFYWLFQRGGTILLGKFRRGLADYSLFMSKTMLEVG